MYWMILSAKEKTLYVFVISTPLVSCLFILAALGLCCCMQPFSGCGEGGYSSLAMRGLLIVVASLVVEHGLSCAVACEIFLDRRSNLCALHWQANSFFPAPIPHPKSSSFLCDPNNLCVLYQMNSTELTWYIFLTSQMFVGVHVSIDLLWNLAVLGLFFLPWLWLGWKFQVSGTRSFVFIFLLILLVPSIWLPQT